MRPKLRNFLYGERVFHVNESTWVGQVVEEYDDLVKVLWPSGLATYELPHMLRRAP